MRVIVLMRVIVVFVYLSLPFWILDTRERSNLQRSLAPYVKPYWYSRDNVRLQFAYSTSYREFREREDSWQLSRTSKHLFI